MAGATAGVLFGGPSVLRAARRQVVIAGRRVKVVDDHVLGTRALSDADRIAILGGNLIKLLRLDPVS